VWLAKIDPQVLIAIAALITATGGVALPFLLPIATKKMQEFEEQIRVLQTRVDECERREAERQKSASRSRR
jgi:hypothetical protein